MSFRVYSLLAGAVFALATFSGSASPYPARAPDFRLSGTVVAGPTSSTAIIKLGSGETQIIAIGEAVPGWGPITDVRRNSIRVSTGDGEYQIWVTAGEIDPAQTGWFAFLPKPSASSSAGPSPSRSPSPQVRAQARAQEHYPEFRAQVERLAADPEEFDEPDDLNKAIVPSVGLPPGARIVAVNHIPVGQDGARPSDIKRMLENQTPVRLSIEGVPGVDAIYMLPRGPVPVARS